MIFFDEDFALSVLLKEGVLFSNYRDYYWDGKFVGKTIVLFVNCNDLFGPYADSLDLPESEIENLYKAYLSNNRQNFIIWCCKQRNQQPWFRVKDKMLNAGEWTQELEDLPENDTCKNAKSL